MAYSPHIQCIFGGHYESGNARKYSGIQSANYHTYQMFKPFRKYTALKKLNKIPRFIWVTPIIMDIFIFKEFRNGSSLRVPCHTGSSPNGYVRRTLIKPSVVASLKKKREKDY